VLMDNEGNGCILCQDGTLVKSRAVFVGVGSCCDCLILSLQAIATKS
jgi:hypothetical protein